MASGEALKAKLPIYAKVFASLNERVMQFFYRPAEAFMRLKNRPRWIMPLLILMAVSISVLLLHHTVIPSRMRIEARQAQLEKYGVQFSESEGQAEQAQQPISFGLVGLVVFSLLLASLITAAAFWAAFSFAGEYFKFKTVLSVFNHAMLPSSITWSLLVGLILFIKDPMEIDPIRLENVVLSNPAAFLDQAAMPLFIHSLLSSADFFSIWTLVLLAIGFSACGEKLPMRKSALITLLVWSVYVFGKASVVSFFSL